MPKKYHIQHQRERKQSRGWGESLETEAEAERDREWQRKKKMSGWGEKNWGRKPQWYYKSSTFIVNIGAMRWKYGVENLPSAHQMSRPHAWARLRLYSSLTSHAGHTSYHAW